MSTDEKPLAWVGPAHKEFMALPRAVIHEAGTNLREDQRGGEPENWKPMESIGPGAREIRIRTYDGGVVQHRVVYVAKFQEAIYVLHAFEKKTAATSQHNLDVARARYRRMLRERQDRRHSERGGKP